MRSIYFLFATIACAAALPAAAPVYPVLPVAREALPEPARKGHFGGPGKRERQFRSLFRKVISEPQGKERLRHFRSQFRKDISEALLDKI